jgi:hypothetical protein
MSKNHENRVLSRKGARCLDEQELNFVSGNGTVSTTFCTVPTTANHKPDGDCD